jgi:hypothetical protein
MIRLLEAAMDERGTVRWVEAVIHWGCGRPHSVPAVHERALVGVGP